MTRHRRPDFGVEAVPLRDPFAETPMAEDAMPRGRVTEADLNERLAERCRLPLVKLGPEKDEPAAIRPVRVPPVKRAACGIFCTLMACIGGGMAFFLLLHVIAQYAANLPK